jgi:hypothetical protein
MPDIDRVVPHVVAPDATVRTVVRCITGHASHEHEEAHAAASTLTLHTRLSAPGHFVERRHCGAARL